MPRLRGGSPHSKKQGQYWVRRHLDDQRFASSSSSDDGWIGWGCFSFLVVAVGLAMLVGGAFS